VTPPALNPAHSGVYHAPAHIDAVRTLVNAEGGLWLEVDLGRARTKDELLQAFAAALDFPATFGHNWDALADALQDFSWMRGDSYFIHLRDAASAARGLGRDWATLLQVLERTAHHWKGRAKPFVVLVDDVSELPPWI
jgi:RNAse (barnase) inhibitor barstar